jgi:hexokinase
MLKGKLTQSGVSPSFRMLVPVFAELGGKNYRVCVVALQGNSTGECRAALSTRPRQILLNINHDILSEKDEVVVAAKR